MFQYIKYYLFGGILSFSLAQLIPEPIELLPFTLLFASGYFFALLVHKMLEYQNNRKRSIIIFSILLISLSLLLYLLLYQVHIFGIIKNEMVKKFIFRLIISGSTFLVMLLRYFISVLIGKKQ